MDRWIPGWGRNALVARVAVATMLTSTLPVHAQTLFLADFESDQIHAMDPTNGVLLYSFAAPGSFSTGLEFVDGVLFVNNYTNCSDDRIYRIDAVSGTIIGSYASPACPVDGLAKDQTGNYLVALAPLGAQLIVFERDTGTVVTTIGLNLDSPDLRGVTWLRDLVYVSDELTDTIYGYSLDIPNGQAILVQSIPIGANCPGLTDNGSMLIAYDIGEHRLLEIDPVSGEVIPRALPPGIGSVAGLAFDPGECPGDFNADGEINSQDFFDFLTTFFLTLPKADFNGDTFVNSQDFFDFLAAFFDGC